MAEIELHPDFKDFLRLMNSHNECYDNREVFELDGIQIYLISLQDLKKNKRATGRHKDLEDIEHLP